MNINKSSIINLQYGFGDTLAYGQNVTYDLYSKDQGNALKDKIKELFPDSEDAKKNNQIRQMRDTLFESIWAQRKYTNKNLVSTIIYVFVTTEKDYMNSTNFSYHPVFVAKRCQFLDDENNTYNCCKIFVDEYGRVYQNWKSYIEDNTLPKGVMVVPKNGVYTVDENKKVELSAYKTPASCVGKQLIAASDIGAATIGLGSLGVLIGAMALPIAAPIVATASMAALCTSLYSGGRSGAQLMDRNKHEQSISLKNREARGNWLGLAATGVGVGASAATGFLTKVATSGQKISTTAKIVVNGMNVTSMAVSASGIGNGAFELFLKNQSGEKCTFLDYAQLSASLIIFTHSVKNFRLASQIINDQRNTQIKTFRESISNRNRKSFDKLSRQLLSMKGETQGKSDIIRILNEMPSTKELNSMIKVNRVVLEQNAQSNPKAAAQSFSSATQNYRNINQIGLNNISQNELSSVNEKTMSMITVSNVVISYFSSKLKAVVCIKVKDYVLKKINSKTDFVNTADLFANIKNELLDVAIEILETFIKSVLFDIEIIIKICISSEQVLLQIFNMFIKPYIYKKTNELINYLKNNKMHIMQKLKEYFLQFRSINETQIPRKCNFCSGFYSIINI